ncbi:MAG: PAS domain S-box protein [Candidatus Dadabacteria bacterium]|nr:PAS domain S-box protein [Candidatus Dadabacteria bacterium]
MELESQINRSLEDWKLQLVIESVPSAIVIISHEGKIVFLNSQTEKIFGYTKNELIGQSVEILVPERFRSKHSEYRMDFYAKPQARPMGVGRDLFALRKDGTELPVEIGLNPMKIEGGVLVLAAIVDITERKRAELQLRKEKDKAQQYLDVAEVIIIAVNDKEEVTLINHKGCRLLGYEEGEIIGKNWFEHFLPGTVREQTRVVFKELIEGRCEPYKYYENPVLTKSSQIRLIAWHNKTITDEVGNITGTLSSGEDITERRWAEERLRESEERLQAIMDNTTDAVMVYDEDGMVIAMNKEAKRLFCSKNKRELKTMWDVIPPENRADFSSRLKIVKEGSRLLDYETEKLLENGERVPVSVGLINMVEGSGWFIETIRDIGERVRIRNKIIELEKAQIVGKMAEGIAHHMGTPLASMLLRVQMLKEDLSEATEYANCMEKLDSIEKQIFYGQRVMQRLLKFASNPENIRGAEDLSTLLTEAIDIIKPLMNKYGIEIELALDKDLKIWAEGNLLQLVFSDIMMNAVDAMSAGGRLSIIASKANSDEKLEIKISDTGIGVPREVLPLVFEPFFTTKPAGKGTGLGLSVAKRVIQDHGGNISIESREGDGTSILIRLPIYKEERALA